MSFPERLSRVAVIPVAPVPFAQGKRLRRVTPILACAALLCAGKLANPNPLRLLVLGDSTAVGVGRGIRVILTALRAASPRAVLMMSSVPAFHRFELLPNPLRRNLYLHSRSLEAEARGIVATFENAIMNGQLA